MSLLTATAKKQITEDWKKSFPHLGAYRAMWLMKRNGPLLMGVILDRTRSNDVYIPKFHVHNLLWSSPFIGLSLACRVPHERHETMEKQIRADRHEASFLSAADELKRLVPETVSSDITISRVVEMYHEFVKQKRDFALARHCTGVFTDIILLSFWGGYDDYALRCLNGATEIIRAWEESGLDVPSWRAAVETQLDRTSMEATLAKEIKKHKLERVPAYKLIPGVLPEPNIIEVYKRVWED